MKSTRVEKPTTGKLSSRNKLLYGVGDTGFSLTSTILGAYFAIFMIDVVNLRPEIAAIAIFIGRSWDYINDPIIGHLSDRTRTRWGRRRPYLLFGALPYALAFSMLWFRPPSESQVYLAIYYSVAYILYDAAATLIYMPYFALTPELTSDYDERTSLTTYRMFFSILGSLLAFTIPLMIVGSFSPENAPRVFGMGLAFGLISAAPMWLVFLGTRERDEFMQQEQPGLRQSLRVASKNRPFLFSLFIYLVTWMSVEIIQAILLFYIKYVAMREAYNDVIMATIFVTAILALPIWEYTSRRLDKRWAYIAGIAFWAAVQIVLITVTSATSLHLILFLCVLAGIGVAAAHILPWSIIPDSIEWGELQSGERHEGMFYSLVTLAHKIAASIAVPLILFLLGRTGYVPNAAVQPESALWGIRIAFGPIPAVLLWIGIFLAYKYPLNRARYAAAAQELERRRLEARQAEAAGETI
ncbi:MAG: MFS transporter [Anaerolineales bacterium]|nr:MFS transporter [Anaerolineales bacterium]